MSVAQEFIHEKLEAESLRESVTLQKPEPARAREHPRSGRFLDEDDNDDVATHVPGSFEPFVDPFQVETKRSGEGSSSSLGEDVEGVSVLAGVIERILARLSVTVREIVVRFVHEGNAELVLRVGEIAYGTEEVVRSEGDAGKVTTEIEVKGMKRTIRIQGVDVSIRSLALLPLEGPKTPLTASEPPSSPIDSNASIGLQLTSSLIQTADPPSVLGIIASLPPQPPQPLDLAPDQDDYVEEDDEEDEMDASMTQSMLSLPPPGTDPSTILSSDDSDGSPSSTMYLSADGSVRAHTPPALTPQELDAPFLPSSSPDSVTHFHITPTRAHVLLPSLTLPPTSTATTNTTSRVPNIGQAAATITPVSDPPPTPPPAPESKSFRQDLPSYRVISFGKDPIIISLMTPPPTRAKAASSTTNTGVTGAGGVTGLDTGVTSASAPPAATLRKGQNGQEGSMNLSVKLGVLTVALDVGHINALVSIGNAVAVHEASKVEKKPVGAKDPRKKTAQVKKPTSAPAPPPAASSSSASSSFLNGVEASLALRGIHLFLFRSSSSGVQEETLDMTDRPTAGTQGERKRRRTEIWDAIFSQPMSTFIEESHMRVHFDGLSLQYAPVGNGKSGIRGGIKDFWVFWIDKGVTIVSHPPPSKKEGETQEVPSSSNTEGISEEKWLASPVLIIDHHLVSQYDSTTVDLRDASNTYSIPVTDWTSPASHVTSVGRPKVSLWRSRPPVHTPGHLDVNAAKSGDHEALEAAICQMNFLTGETSVEIAPLHLFVDTRMVQWTLAFVQLIQIDTPSSSGLPEKLMEEEEDVYAEPRSRGGRGWMVSSVPENMSYLPKAPKSPIITPKSHVVELPRLSGEQEKQRLRDFVLSDMEMAGERQSIDSESGIHIRCAVIRCEVRCGPTTPFPRLTKRNLARQRSGAMVVDIHNPHLTLPSNHPISDRKSRTVSHSHATERKPHFVTPGSEEEQGGLSELPLNLRFEWANILALYAAPVGSKAVPFLCIGEQNQTQYMQDAMETQVKGLFQPTIAMRSGPPVSQHHDRFSASMQPSTTSVEVMVPSIVSTIEKPLLGGLQLWADDMAQWAEKATMVNRSANVSQTTSRAQSVLIGSRYFVGRTASNVGEEPEYPTYSELSIKVNIFEAKIRLRVPTSEDLVRNVDVLASGIDTGVEVKPGGRDETAILAKITDVTLQDTLSDQTKVLFTLTSPRRLFAPPAPMIRLRLDSVSLPDSKAKQSKVQLTTSKFTLSVYPDLQLFEDLARFAKAPPGVFEQVAPTERTVLDVNFKDASIQVIPPNHPGSLVLNLEDVSVGTDIVSGSVESSVNVIAQLAHVLLIDDLNAPAPEALQNREVIKSLDHWLKIGYASVLNAVGLRIHTAHMIGDVPRTRVDISDATASVHLCADTIPTLAAIAGDLATLAPKEEAPPAVGVTAVQSAVDQSQASMSMILENNAYKQPPRVGPEPDMVEDDLPKNPDYLDASYGAAAGARPIEDEDLEDPESDDEFGGRRTPTPGDPSFIGIISTYGKETIKMLTTDGLKIIEGYFDRLPPVEQVLSSNRQSALMSLRITGTRLHLHLHSGYDWHRTRKAIEEEVKSIRRRLEKIKQLLANGQTPDNSIERTDAFLFNSVYLGLDTDIEDLEGQDLVAAIDANLADEFETASQDSWQTLPSGVPQQPRETRMKKKRNWGRSKGSEVEIQVQGLNAEVNKFGAEETVASHILARIRDLKILDHMKTSTWDNFLTSMRTDSRGNKRETDSDMVRLELKVVRPAPKIPHEEARLKAKILPIRLHVDQDALDFLKKFFAFQDVNGFQPPVAPQPQPEMYFQRVEIFPVALKLDYKPKRVDYKALKEGRTIELMNFFHFEDAEMTLRQITLNGIQGWARLGDTLNDMWTPDVKANQLADVISGVAPIRSIVNVGTGLADLVLLPIAQYKKDKRLVRGVQKGTAAFMKTTAMETIKLGARLATGTQVILEHAERALGADRGLLDDGRSIGTHGRTITTETLPSPTIRAMSTVGGSESESLVPIAVIKPMIGASEAVRETLLGLRNTLDPDIIQANEDKYKGVS
ncbi:autophagy- protein 2 [Serendipita sp. 400]|nr:autophagy- protein 2 [Serendipita sp. 400]